jgi:hypothetical protein
MRQKRQQVAQKQAAIDAEMTPYKLRMAQELERLNQEMLLEENAYTEEEEQYIASVEVLRAFKHGDGGGGA